MSPPDWYSGVVQMTVMAQPWKHPVSGIFYFRRDVPESIRGVMSSPLTAGRLLDCVSDGWGWA